MKEKILFKVRQLVADVFNLPLEEIISESSQNTVANWDSLQHLNLVLALEQSFGLNFLPEEIEKMINVSTIVRLIQKKLSLSTGEA